MRVPCGNSHHKVRTLSRGCQNHIVVEKLTPSPRESTELSLIGGHLILCGNRVAHIREVSRLRASVAEQEQQNQQLTERNERLKAEVTDLKGGFAALEERARSDLGMVGPEESFFLFVPAESDQPDQTTGR